jgi:hypothetical protein
MGMFSEPLNSLGKFTKSSMDFWKNTSYGKNRAAFGGYSLMGGVSLGVGAMTTRSVYNSSRDKGRGRINSAVRGVGMGFAAGAAWDMGMIGLGGVISRFRR